MREAGVKPTADIQMEEEQQAQFRVKVRQKRLRVTLSIPLPHWFRQCIFVAILSGAVFNLTYMAANEVSFAKFSAFQYRQYAQKKKKKEMMKV